MCSAPGPSQAGRTRLVVFRVSYAPNSGYIAVPRYVKSWAITGRPRCNKGRRKLAPPARCNRFPCRSVRDRLSVDQDRGHD